MKNLLYRSRCRLRGHKSENHFGYKFCPTDLYLREKKYIPKDNLEYLEMKAQEKI